jgi:hypothetical protein
MWRIFERRHDWVPDLLLVVAAAAASSACAVSRPFDRPAAVILRDGKPCLFAPGVAASEEADWMGVAMTAMFPLGRAKAVWVADIVVQRPSAADRCVVYGASFPRQDVRVPAAPLPDRIQPYLAVVGIGPFGSKGSGRYGVWFCFGKDSAGMPVLKRWDDSAERCTVHALTNEE